MQRPVQMEYRRLVSQGQGSPPSSYHHSGQSRLAYLPLNHPRRESGATPVPYWSVNAFSAARASWGHDKRGWETLCCFRTRSSRTRVAPPELSEAPVQEDKGKVIFFLYIYNFGPIESR